jgi:NADH:ubiquinone oxidoreductase subunit F (NADH-binding)
MRLAEPMASIAIAAHAIGATAAFIAIKAEFTREIAAPERVMHARGGHPRGTA